MILPYSDSANKQVIDAYMHFIENATYPCIAAKAAMTRGNISCFVADDMGDDSADQFILDFIYSFVEEFRQSKDMYHSVSIIFRNPVIQSEEQYDRLLWERLQSLSDLDASLNNYDPRVNQDPRSGSFSFSLKGEAFYIIGLHPSSSREARKFTFPTMVFNPHAQFEQLRNMMKYEVMKTVVRKRDAIYSGSVNPMLEDFGKRSEVFQYSGRSYSTDWKCPLKINHGSAEHHPSS